MGVVGGRFWRALEVSRFHDYRASPFLEEECRCIQSLLLFIPAGCRSTEGGHITERSVETECFQLSCVAGFDEEKCKAVRERKTGFARTVQGSFLRKSHHVGILSEKRTGA